MTAHSRATADPGVRPSATGGWGFFHFLNDRKSLTDEKTIQGCFDCHTLNQDHDLVFTHYAP